RNRTPHQRSAVAQVGDHPVRRRADTVQMAGADRRGGRTARPADIDNPPAGDVPLEGAAGLQLDLGPRDVGDRGKLAVQVVHHGIPFRLPMPSEPSWISPSWVWEVSPVSTTSCAAAAGVCGSGGGSLRKSTVGAKNSQIG